MAHTVVVGSTPETRYTGRQADVLLAAHYASEAVLRLMTPGTEVLLVEVTTGSDKFSDFFFPVSQNQAVTQTVQKVAESYKCKPIEGMLSHQLKQFEIDGQKTIIQNPNEAQRKEHEKCTFELHEVYAIDVLVSTGEGVVRRSVCGVDYRCLSFACR